MRALPERAHLEIRYPRVVGYRWDVGAEKLEARFDDDSRMVLSTQDVPSWTEVEPVVGEGQVHLLELKNKRRAEVEFKLAREAMRRYLVDPDAPKGSDGVRHWLFPQLLEIARRWLRECVVKQDDAFEQMLLLDALAATAAAKIHRSIAVAADREARLVPILRPHDTVGSTALADFDTTKPTWITAEDRCHVSHVVADTGQWEQKLAHSLEDMEEVRAYVKNDRVGFAIPYVLEGQERQYVPDFLLRWDDGHGEHDLLNVIVEVTGEKKPDKAEKVATARTLWVPAVNRHGGFGRWAFVEVTDPWETKSLLRAALRASADRTTLAAGRRRVGETPVAAPARRSDETRIEKTPGVCGGSARIRGTRIPVWVLVGYRQLGKSDAELLEAYPSLDPDDLAAAFLYYSEHRQEIDREIERQDSEPRLG